MGNLLSKNKTNETQNPNSVWGFGGSESTVGGLYFSSNGNVVRIYYRPNRNRSCTVFVGSKPFIPTGIEITIDDKKTLSVFFMNGENRVGDPLMWEETQYEIGINNELLSIEKKTSKEKAPPKKRESPNMGTVDMTSALNSGHVISHRGIFLGAGEVPAGELVRVIPSEDAVFTDVTIINIDDLCPSRRSQAGISSAEVQQMNNPFGGQTEIQQEPLLMALGSSEKNVFQEFPMTGPPLEIFQPIGGYPKDISHIEQRFEVNDVNLCQDFARCGSPKESTTGIKTVLAFSVKQYLFTVLDDLKSMGYRLKKADNYPLNLDFPVQFGIINISSLTVYELSDGVYLIVIQTNLGQTYLSGYLSTNATPIFATCQITTNSNQIRFQSFEHVSGTVFKCLFSDGTERTFSIESSSYATIKEVLDA